MERRGGGDERGAAGGHAGSASVQAAAGKGRGVIERIAEDDIVAAADPGLDFARKKVVQKRSNILNALGATQVEQDDADARHRQHTEIGG